LKTVVYTRFGPPEVLQHKEMPIPVPGDGEVCVRVHATTVTAAESAMRQGKPLWGRVIIGFTGPRRRFRTLGNELAGTVTAVGRNVKRFTVGDEVFGFAGFRIGANAEYHCLPESASLAPKPVNVGFEQAAAAVDGASTALYFLRDKANVQPGQRVAIIGASGSIGTYAVQLAKHLGAEVTGICSTGNVELVRGLGADHVIDYTVADFTRNTNTYDVIFDAVGRSTFGRCKGALTATGVYLPTTGLHNYLLDLWTRVARGRRVKAGMSVEKNDSLRYLTKLIESGNLTIVIDRTYPLGRIVEAHRYVDSGRKRGNVVITMPAGGEQPRTA
jgi:NADPH2:quinone reductase